MCVVCGVWCHMCVVHPVHVLAVPRPWAGTDMACHWSMLRRYGFQDTMVKSGAVLYSSLLQWNASRLLGFMARASNDTQLAARMDALANAIKRGADTKLWSARTLPSAHHIRPLNPHCLLHGVVLPPMCVPACNNGKMLRWSGMKTEH